MSKLIIQLIFLGGPILIIFLNVHYYKLKKKRIINQEKLILQNGSDILDQINRLELEERLSLLKATEYEKQLDKSYKNLLLAINKKYGTEILRKFIDKELWIGMPPKLALFVKGKPKEIKENVSEAQTTEYWYYGRYKTSHGTIKYQRQIVIENGVVHSWQDL